MNLGLARRPNPRLQRTPSASPPSPLSRQPLGRTDNQQSRHLPAPSAMCLLVSVVLLACRVGPGGWYRSVSIDSTTATLVMHDRIQSSGNQLREGFRDDLALSGHQIAEYGAETGGRYPLRNSFLTDRQYRLIERGKNEELLRGEFGSVYAKSTYFYDSRYRGQATGFEVNSYSKLVSSDLPTLTATVPAESAAQLVAVSLVRIVRAHPGVAVFAATYSPDGQLQSLSVDAARGGDWVVANEFVGSNPPINGGRFYGAGIHLRPWYGIPSSFPVEDYITAPAVRWPSIGYPEQFAAVHLHYESNSWVRQDIYVDGNQTVSRSLHFPSTSSGRALAAIDSHRGFGRWTRAAWDGY